MLLEGSHRGRGYMGFFRCYYRGSIGVFRGSLGVIIGVIQVLYMGSIGVL